jgi:hypothetical protein
MSGLRRAVLANRLASGALTALAGLVAISLLIMLAEVIGHFSGGMRAVLLALWVLSALAALGLGIVWPMLKYTVFAPTDQKLAGEYARRMPTIRDRVLNALQLLERVEGANREGYSTDLILEAGKAVAEDLAPIDPRKLPDKKTVQLGRKAAIAAVGLAAVLFVFAGGHLLSAAERVMKPGEEFLPPAPFTLSIQPGNAKLVRGDSLAVEVTATGAVPSAVTIERQEKGKSASEPVTVKGENGIFRYVYRGVTASFEYWAHQDAAKSERYAVEVEELPAVRFLALKLTPPSYTGLEEQALEENVGDVSALKGTLVKLSLAATKPLKEARIEFEKVDTLKTGGLLSAPTRIVLVVEGSKAHAEFMIEANGYYQIHLKDTEGLENRDPIRYRITARPDEAPVITLLEPAHDLEIAANVRVAVVSEAMDDYGFSRMVLRYMRTSGFDAPGSEPKEEDYKTLSLEYKMSERGKARSDYVWDMTPLDLLPEDQVTFFVEVWDNDRITGPKRGKSETRVLRFPSMAEIFEQQEKQEETRQISLADLLKESKELREKVEEAVEEYKSNPELNWERKKEIEQLLEQQKAMTDILEQVANAMEQAQQQMQQRSMFSPEVMDKLKQVQKLAQEVITPEMREAMRKLAEAMKQPNEEELRKAMENFKMTQEMFEQALDQALNVLKQLKMEKKLDELTRRLDELGRQQEQLNKKMNENTPQTAPKNAEDQKKLAEEMKKIEQEMKKLAEEMKQNQTPGEKKMDQAQKKAEQEKLSEQMKENSNSMKMCQNQSASKKGKHARKKMAEMADELQQIKQEMQQDENQEALEKLERTRDQLLDLSMRQEQLWKESQNIDPSSPQMTEAAEEQENLRQALSRIDEDLKALARESMFVTPKLSAAMHQALAQMAQANTAMQSRDPRTASYYRQQSLAALNGALKENQSSCSSCKKSCNKPNPNSSCNKAGQMASQQRKLSQNTQPMMGQCQNPGSLSMGEQAAMQRLADEQHGLARGAKELAEEVAASQQSVGKLDDVAKDMEEVAKDLENKNVTERTLQKQEHIESRLLDFQRANREREFSPRRTSAEGIDMVRSSPRELPQKPGQDQLKEDLLRALDAKYSPDYEDLIRKYFDALSKVK